MERWIEKLLGPYLTYKQIFNFNDERIMTEEDFNLADANNMDSVNRVAILVALEKEYDFIFKLKEISAWNTVRELAAIVEKKM